MLLAAALAGVALLAFASRLAGARAAAPALPPAAPATPPSTLAILPVRDEAAQVVACVESLLGQSAPLELRVVDDGSRDATAALVAGLAAKAGGRLTLASAGPLPAGWSGKVHALARGSAGAESEWLLFTDADTRHHPELLARAHAAAAAGPLDLVSIAGHQRVSGWGASLLTPPVFALLDADLGDWAPYAEGEGEPPLANGQFLLVRRAALAAAGGLEPLARVALDDVTLARRLVAAGGRAGFFRALDLLEVEMYPGFRAAWQGWRRNLALLYGSRAGFAGAVASFAALPALGVTVLLATGALPAAGLLWALAAIASGVLRTSARFPAAPALVAPLEGLLFAALLLTALADFRRGRLAPWRGRELPPPGADVDEAQPGSGAE